MDCRATATAPACNDDKNGISKKVDSSDNTHSPSSRAAQSGVAIHNTKVDSSNARNITPESSFEHAPTLSQLAQDSNPTPTPKTPL